MHQFLQDLDNVNKPNLASVESVDYVNAEERRVNPWVERQTNEEHQGLLSNGSASSSVVLVPMNKSISKGSGIRILIKNILKKENFG